MKKMKWLSAMLIAGVFAFTACSDDEEKGEVFSKLTPEQHKQELETEGIAFAQKMDAVGELKLYDVMDAFMGYQEQEELNTALAFGLHQVNGLRNGAKTTVDLKGLTQTGNGSISSGFGEESGIYTWDGQGFVYTPAENEITYIFPVENSEAKITVNNFTYVVAKNQDVEGFDVELPTSLYMGVELDETILCSYTFTGEWYENDTPKLLKEVMTLEGFNLTCELNNSKTKMTLSSSFDYNSDVIFANAFTIEGNVDYSAILAEADKLNGTEGMPEEFNQDILTKANAWFQIGNVKAEGVVDVKGMINAMEDGFNTIDSEEALKTLFVEVANEKAQIYVRYADSDEIIAKSEFYLGEYNDYDWVYDETTGSYNEVMEVKTEPAMRMIFADGSAVDGDFFENGFGDMITEIEALIAEVEANFSDDSNTPS